MLYMKPMLHSLATLASFPKMVTMIVGVVVMKDTAVALPFNLQVRKSGSELLPCFYVSSHQIAHIIATFQLTSKRGLKTLGYITERKYK